MRAFASPLTAGLTDLNSRSLLSRINDPDSGTHVLATYPNEKWLWQFTRSNFQPRPITKGKKPEIDELTEPAFHGKFREAITQEAMQVFILHGEQQSGPYDLASIGEGVMQGTIAATDLAWTEGCAEWMPLDQLVDLSEVPKPSASPPPLPAAAPPQAVSKPKSFLADTLTQFTGDEQDPSVVENVLKRVKELLTRDEVVEYVGVQKKPVINISPDAIVLTNRRFMIVRPKLLGMTFEDYQWREVLNVHMSEQMLGATITCAVIGGKNTAIDSIPKKQARRIYAYAQDVEERVHDTRRQRELEALRASAGGVVIHGPSQNAPMASGATDDPTAVLSKLKGMMESGLITSEEFNAKKSDILSRM